MFIYRVDAGKIINVGEGNINGIFGGDGGIDLTIDPTIKISLAISYNAGVTLRGYGLSIKALYLK